MIYICEGHFILFEEQHFLITACNRTITGELKRGQREDIKCKKCLKQFDQAYNITG